MYLPPLQPVANSDIRICGDVEIHATASIAPGVILQAAPNSKIIIGVDVCIGMGAIISACGGVVEIGNGVTLGSGVLIVGQSKIGQNACIGTASTVFNASVEPMSVINPGSIIGDVSRQENNGYSPSVTEKVDSEAIAIEAKIETKAKQNGRGIFSSEQDTTNASNGFIDSNIDSTSDLQESTSDLDPSAVNSDEAITENNLREESSDPWQEKKLPNSPDKKTSISSKKIETKENSNESEKAIGKVYIDRLLVTLFPHKKHLDLNSDS